MPNCPYVQPEWACELRAGHDGPHTMQVFPEVGRDASRNAPSDRDHSCSSPTCAINGITPSGYWPDTDG